MQYGTPETLATMLVALLIGIGIGYAIWGWRGSAGPGKAPTGGRAKAAQQDAARGLTGRTGSAPAAAAPEPAANEPAGTAEAPATAEPRGLLSEAPDELDDLKRIKGVGPKMEGLLHDRGFYLYRQIATLSPEEAAWLDEALGTFPGRISRDDWVGQARTLHREKYGADPG